MYLFMYDRKGSDRMDLFMYDKKGSPLKFDRVDIELEPRVELDNPLVVRNSYIRVTDCKKRESIWLSFFGLVPLDSKI